MPGSIKIDDGSGNYTILTNAGSLGSDKTITIPNETATLATTNATNLGGLVKLAEYTFSSDADKDFDVCDGNTYFGYKLVFKDMISAVDGGSFRVGLRNDGADVLTSTTTERFAVAAETNSSSSIGGSASNPSGYFDITFGTGNSSNEMGHATCELFPHDTEKLWHSSAMYERTDGLIGYLELNALMKNNSTVDGVRIFASNGNISSGKIAIWGYKK